MQLILLTILIVYNLILTLFVVKIHNKPELDLQSLRDEIQLLKNQRAPLTDIDYEPIETPHTNTPDLAQLSDQFDKMLATKSREEIETWIEEKPNQNLNNLNKNYGKQY